jgi:hypothetical protein
MVAVTASRHRADTGPKRTEYVQETSPRSTSVSAPAKSHTPPMSSSQPAFPVKDTRQHISRMPSRRGNIDGYWWLRPGWVCAKAPLERLGPREF